MRIETISNTIINTDSSTTNNLVSKTASSNREDNTDSLNSSTDSQPDVASNEIISTDLMSSRIGGAIEATDTVITIKAAMHQAVAPENLITTTMRTVQPHSADVMKTKIRASLKIVVTYHNAIAATSGTGMLPSAGSAVLNRANSKIAALLVHRAAVAAPVKAVLSLVDHLKDLRTVK